MNFNAKGFLISTVDDIVIAIVDLVVDDVEIFRVVGVIVVI